jgi:hypothetical protein
MTCRPRVHCGWNPGLDKEVIVVASLRYDGKGVTSLNRRVGSVHMTLLPTVGLMLPGSGTGTFSEDPDRHWMDARGESAKAAGGRAERRGCAPIISGCCIKYS